METALLSSELENYFYSTALALKDQPVEMVKSKLSQMYYAGVEDEKKRIQMRLRLLKDAKDYGEGVQGKVLDRVIDVVTSWLA
jgi:hypothetical protein